MDATTEYEMTRPVSLGLRRRDISQYLIRNDAESLKSDFSHSSKTTNKETATGISNDETYLRIGRGSIKKPIEKEHPIGERDRSIFPIFGNTEKVDKDESQAIYTDDGNRKENSDTLVEQEFQGIKNDEANSVENSFTSEPVLKEERGIVQEPDEYIYKILRFNESYDGGLRPKNIFSRVSLQQHVDRGSKGQESRFISCCKTLYGIERLGSLTNEFQRIREVVRINITKLKDRAQIIDLTKEEIRERHISRYSTAWGYAERFEEVIIDPTSHVPSECVEKIGVVHMRSFKKT
ncbi:uncharacterized protein LOC134253686 [Saccostrea cucullata]|uniref:uncharacterized protein LOC134253686 n=1 Tax=Saccostrea cuccullata TaxID=36930 RepID=UPI002ED6515B